VNLAVALCSTDTLAGLLLSAALRVASARRGLMIEGGAALRGVNISTLPHCFRSRGQYVLGATNYRSLRDDEPAIKPGIIRMQWI
jgi:hypothetical protein